LHCAGALLAIDFVAAVLAWAKTHVTEPFLKWDKEVPEKILKIRGSRRVTSACG
jgi:hypothetical protein